MWAEWFVDLISLIAHVISSGDLICALRSYNDYVWYVIENRWKCHIQIIKDGIVEPKLFDECNKEEFWPSDEKCKGLYTIIGAMST